MFDQNSKHAIVTFGENGIEDLTEISMYGEELTDDELALVAGAMRGNLHYVGKTFHDGEVHDDWIIL